MKIVYIATIIISTFLILLSYRTDCLIDNTINSIGCSGIAAAIMAIFLEKEAKHKEQKEKKKARRLYFSELYNELKLLIERIIWLDDRMNDIKFRWDLTDSFYYSQEYMLSDFNKHRGYDLNQTEMKKRLAEIKTKYNLESQQEMSSLEEYKMYKMLSIICFGKIYLINQIEIIENNKVILNEEGYLSLQDIDKLRNNLHMAFYIMSLKNKNYGIAVSLILEAYEIMNEIYGDDNKPFRIELYNCKA